MRFLVAFALLSLSQITFAQNLQDQFTDLRDNSETFKEYKVIKIYELNRFWKGVADTLKTNNATISELQKKIVSHDDEIKKLNNMIAESKANILDLEFGVEHITIFGLPISKTAYQVLNFTIIVTLLVLIAFLFFKYNERRSTAREKINAFNNLEEKFADYQKTALEKQMKLRRELQTERNKLEQIRGIN
jgi:predicted  nucleic acid-binding Zn-ribbon protein